MRMTGRDGERYEHDEEVRQLIGKAHILTILCGEEVKLKFQLHVVVPLADSVLIKRFNIQP